MNQDFQGYTNSESDKFSRPTRSHYVPREEARSVTPVRKTKSTAGMMQSMLLQCPILDKTMEKKRRERESTSLSWVRKIEDFVFQATGREETNDLLDDDVRAVLHPEDLNDLNHLING